MFKTLVELEVERQFPSQRRGRPRLLTFDDAYDDILKVLKTGMQWRQLQPRVASHITVFKTMQSWVQRNIFQTAYQRLLKLYNRRRRPKYHCIDSSFVKNIYGRDVVGRNPTDRGRRATKLSVIVDDLGVPFSLIALPANRSDQISLQPTIESMLCTPIHGLELYADKGYDSNSNRRFCTAKGLCDRIFKRRTTNGRRTHAKRGVIERYFSWHDKCRRLIVRYEQKANTYLAFTFLHAGTRLSNLFFPNQI